MFHSGFIALIGRPNVGKSTLLNRLVGQKIAITSHVVQTTRHRIQGILTRPGVGQLIFVDTPGFTKALDDLGHFTTQEGQAALSEADVMVVVVDGSHVPGKGDTWMVQQAQASTKPVVLVVNKLDRVAKENHSHRIAMYHNLFGDTPPVGVMGVSARTGKSVEKLIDLLLPLLPEGPEYFPADQLTDQRYREMVGEIIREKVLRSTQDEIPHSVAIAIESYDESNPELLRIKATLYVDQPSQKPILIGQAGQGIKSIGTQARQSIEALVGTKVFLELHVKVKRHWRKDAKFLNQLGLAAPTQA
jgi:GTP-binding protein Era